MLVHKKVSVELYNCPIIV